jgi:dihydropteroate synthase
VDTDWALRRACELVREGADIIDVGAESARTNRAAISEDEEYARLAPFLHRFRDQISNSTPIANDQIFPPLLSINTWRPAVARKALAIDGDILNDMGGLPSPENAAICAGSGAALLIMHTQGEPKIAHTHIGYRDVISEMIQFFVSRIEVAKTAGLSDEQIILDPGIDFAKQRSDNLRVLREMNQLVALGYPVVIGEVLGITDPKDRDAGTISCMVGGQLRGAAIFRVHNVVAARLASLALHRLEHGC